MVEFEKPNLVNIKDGIRRVQKRMNANVQKNIKIIMGQLEGMKQAIEYLIIYIDKKQVKQEAIEAKLKNKGLKQYKITSDSEMHALIELFSMKHGHISFKTMR